MNLCKYLSDRLLDQKVCISVSRSRGFVDHYKVLSPEVIDQSCCRVNSQGSSPYEVGDIVTLKKVHPCGSRDWEILRVGADFRLKCTGCGHQIMVPRKMVEKNTKNLILT